MLLIRVPDLKERDWVTKVSLIRHKGFSVINLCLLSLKLSKLVLEYPWFPFKVLLKYCQSLCEHLIKPLFNVIWAALQFAHLLNQILHLILQPLLLIYHSLIILLQLLQSHLVSLMQFLNLMLRVLIYFLLIFNYAHCAEGLATVWAVVFEGSLAMLQTLSILIIASLQIFNKGLIILYAESLVIHPLLVHWLLFFLKRFKIQRGIPEAIELQVLYFPL